MIFSTDDLHQIAGMGINSERLTVQIERFKQGFPFLNIQKPATVGDGIIQLDEEGLVHKIRVFNQESENHKIIKFVPASGAASRMFKLLFEFFGSNNPDEMLKDEGFNSISYFFNHLKEFAFYQDLKSCEILKDIDFERELNPKEYKIILKALLTDQGLNYGNKPKGLLKFHRYGNESKTSTQEHIMEGALYASSNSELFLHFTVSPEHLDFFKEHVRKSVPQIEKLFELSCYVSFSVQKVSTDTIAVDQDNELFRNNDKTLLFRPGGHGALIENLNELDADLVFIKNIDNVVPDRLKKTTVDYKKAIAGILFEYQKKIFSYLRQLDKIAENNEDLPADIENFVFEKLFIEPSENYKLFSSKERFDFLYKKLNRPLRVCGMVKNEGEPGGGPFWAVNPDGTCSLQVVESSQIDMKNPEKVKLVSQATHFNPVDLVCGITDYKGNRFDLKKYIDQDTGFISEKSKDGKTLKALELPGLWNGAMSDWNTLFVEVPLITFNPVKTVNDLLRPEHQPVK